MKKRDITSLPSATEWVAGWRKTRSEPELLGLLHVVMRVECKMLESENFRGGWEIYRYRFLLLTADIKSGYSPTIRLKALTLLMNECRNSKSLVLGENDYNKRGSQCSCLKYLLWFLRVDIADRAFQSRNWILLKSSLPRHLLEWFDDEGVKRLFTMCRSDLLIFCQYRHEIFNVLCAYDSDRTVQVLRDWLYQQSRADCWRGRKSIQVDYKTMETRLQILDKAVHNTLDAIVMKRYESHETALLDGDPLAHFLVSLSKARELVQVGKRREALLKERDEIDAKLAC